MASKAKGRSESSLCFLVSHLPERMCGYLAFFKEIAEAGVPMFLAALATAFASVTRVASSIAGVSASIARVTSAVTRVTFKRRQDIQFFFLSLKI